MLTEKQRRFADYYIETGNAAEAARRAGYSKRTARSIGKENLTKPYITTYISSRLDAISASRLADAREVLEMFTAILRGNITDQFGLPPSIHDRIEAGRAILRRLERLEDREGPADILDKARAVLSDIESVIR